MENEEPETGRQASRREEIQEIIDKRVEHLIRQSENPETGSPDASLGAGTNDLAVVEDRAGAADAHVAADLDAGEPHAAENSGQLVLVRIKDDGSLDAVDLQTNSLQTHSFSFPYGKLLKEHTDTHSTPIIISFALRRNIQTAFFWSEKTKNCCEVDTVLYLTKHKKRP